MKNYYIALILTIVSFIMNAQEVTHDSIIDLDGLSKKGLYSIQSDGWTLVKSSSRNKISLINFSNKDYILHFTINCKSKSLKPSFLIEFSNNYRDGHRGGLDFTSSKSDRFKKISFLVDEKDYQNPFQNYNKVVFDRFTNALKKGTSLTIKFYDERFEPEPDEEKLTLNRGIDFMLLNSKLLDRAVDCKER